MPEKQTNMTTRAGASSPATGATTTNLSFTRREMLGIAGVAGLTALTNVAKGAAASPQRVQRKPRSACIASYWAAPNSHADWIFTKLLDGYWWDDAYKESRVEVVGVYIHQLAASPLGQKVCEAKGIPIFDSVGKALTLGGDELAVDGVAIVGEHGVYPTDQKGHWLLPRWWMYNQVIQVFERSKRSVPVFNDKHLSYNWEEAKWMYDKSRELNFPLMGGSSIPFYYRTPEVELKTGTPIRNSIVLGGAGDEGGIFHAIDVLQSFVELRKGGETGVKSVQSIRGADAWTWVESNPWVGKLLAAVAGNFDLGPRHFQQDMPKTNICVIHYNDGTQAAVIGARNVGWTYAGEIEGQAVPTVISMLGWPGPFDQYHASNAQPHWITEMMVTGKEPFNAERLLLSTGIVNWYMESNWENGRYSPVGRQLDTPMLNMTYQPTRGAQFSTGERPPSRPYIRGFDK